MTLGGKQDSRIHDGIPRKLARFAAEVPLFGAV